MTFDPTQTKLYIQDVTLRDLGDMRERVFLATVTRRDRGGRAALSESLLSADLATAARKALATS